ncbi:amidoligase family protein [Myxococcota bacterium]|nr:amidoligase family protein [Myxococcota bacterium]
MFDLTTGLELELLLPEHLGRLALASDLADWADARLEIFPFVSKVPMPSADDVRAAAKPGTKRLEPAEATLALVQSIAEHHQAMLHSVSDAGDAFYLIHRAGRLVADDGTVLLTIVHDNTIAGGERVAELVTPPLARARLPWLVDLLHMLAEIPGIVIPESGALHVHVDGRPFREVRALTSLVELYVAAEPVLRAVLATPDSFRAAQPLPSALLPALRELAAKDAPFDDVKALLARRIRDRRHGLNLYNLHEDDDAKLTVELKLARGTLDAARVVAIRELFVACAGWALAHAGQAPGAIATRDALFERVELAAEHRATLGT